MNVGHLETDDHQIFSHIRVLGTGACMFDALAMGRLLVQEGKLILNQQPRIAEKGRQMRKILVQKVVENKAQAVNWIVPDTSNQVSGQEYFSQWVREMCMPSRDGDAYILNAFVRHCRIRLNIYRYQGPDFTKIKLFQEFEGVPAVKNGRPNVVYLLNTGRTDVNGRFVSNHYDWLIPSNIVRPDKRRRTEDPITSTTPGHLSHV